MKENCLLLKVGKVTNIYSKSFLISLFYAGCIQLCHYRYTVSTRLGCLMQYLKMQWPLNLHINCYLYEAYVYIQRSAAVSTSRHMCRWAHMLPLSAHLCACALGVCVCLLCSFPLPLAPLPFFLLRTRPTASFSIFFLAVLFFETEEGGKQIQFLSVKFRHFSPLSLSLGFFYTSTNEFLSVTSKRLS